MKNLRIVTLLTKKIVTLAIVAVVSLLSIGQFAAADVSKKELKSISTPASVKTPLGTLKFFDGVPTDATVKKVYDHLDRMRGVQVFLNTLGGASVYRLRAANAKIGADKANKVAISAQLLDSKSLYLTANTSTLYVQAFLDTEIDGPTVIEIPPGMLGLIDDAWFRYVADLGVIGPDKGKGGKYLVLPPGYKGDVPSGYFVVRPKTFWTWAFVRGSIAKGLEPEVEVMKSKLKVYPLAQAKNPPKTEFIDFSGVSYNTVSPNDFGFYEDLNQVIQKEPIDSLDPETRGLVASIGIVKGKPFKPDARMKKLLTEAVAIGNATARAILFQPREKAAYFYPDSKSAWVMAYFGHDVFFEVDGARNLDADYAMAFLDSKKRALNGAKTYKLHLPPNVPVNNFWAVTMYDTQTRSQLQTKNPLPTLGSQTKGVKKNADGSYDIYFGPKPPKGKEGNWLQTIPGKSWFTILRMYGPLKPWIDKTWRPSELELVK
ncbi:MAG: DUF1254 domain-containing protein [Deltaproteobacteria bacterium]|nr:DUF1254 domain-containing protein [Deltaproteobacteria bacterium]